VSQEQQDDEWARELLLLIDRIKQDIRDLLRDREVKTKPRKPRTK